MSRRSRIFFGLLLIYIVGMAWVLHRVVSDLDPRYRESAEESLVETSQLLATLVEQDVRDGVIDAARVADLMQATGARRFDARIFSVRKQQVALRAYVTDSRGVVVFDSSGQAQGHDFSQWRDVRRALQGQYGARSTRDVADDPQSSVMYVAAPVRSGGRIVGVVSVGKPVQSFGQFVDAARQRIVYAGVLSALSIVFLAVLVSVWLVRPLGLVGDFVRYARTPGSLRPDRLLRRLWAMWTTAYGEMRDALAGRNYVADYVQTLTHEVKSPLSAIRGAAELLQEPMPEAQRQRFVDNIQRETLRIQEIVDRMMELTALETRRVLDSTTAVAVQPLLQDLAHAFQPVAAQRGLVLQVGTVDPHAGVQADPFLLRQALRNLIDNALDFSPAGGVVELGARVQGAWVALTVADQGPGIPPYAQDKVFTKFYSLPRPQSQKKSTGLGLSFVQEIAHLHHGRVNLVNRPASAADGAGTAGAVATLSLPWVAV